jgi:hypothetical protein
MHWPALKDKERSLRCMQVALVLELRLLGLSRRPLRLRGESGIFRATLRISVFVNLPPRIAFLGNSEFQRLLHQRTDQASRYDW